MAREKTKNERTQEAKELIRLGIPFTFVAARIGRNANYTYRVLNGFVRSGAILERVNQFLAEYNLQTQGFDPVKGRKEQTTKLDAERWARRAKPGMEDLKKSQSENTTGAKQSELDRLKAENAKLKAKVDGLQKFVIASKPKPKPAKKNPGEPSTSLKAEGKTLPVRDGAAEDGRLIINAFKCA